MDYTAQLSKEQIEDAWEQFEDVPIGDDDCIGVPFSMAFGFKYVEGTDRFEIMRDFDRLYAEWGGIEILLLRESLTETKGE